MKNEKYSQNELREIFSYGVKTVASLLGIGIEKLSRDKYIDTCQKEGIKYINPYFIGGYTKARAEMMEDGTFSNMATNPITNDAGTKRDHLKQLLVKYIKENHFVPNQREFKNFSNYSIAKYFKSMTDFYEETEQDYPEVKDFLFNENFYTSEYREQLAEVIKNNNKFIITSAVCGKEVDENFFNSLKNYAKRNKAVVLVLPLVSKDKKSLNCWDLDPKLKEFWVVFEEVSLNENLRLWDIRINSKQIMSLTGLDRAVAPLNASIIVGSTKQAIKYIPTSKRRVPHMLASTGCCTKNDYTIQGLMPNRATKIAEITHKLGAIIIEIENNKIFYPRNIEAGPSGEIIDLCKLYSPDGRCENVKNVVLDVGDLHVPKHNIDLVNKHLKLIPKLNVSTVVLHDTVNMGCVSHHNVGKRCLKALQALRGENTIEGEAEALKTVLEKFSKSCTDVIIPFSNHPEHLNKYLEEARFVDDSVNFYISLDLAKAYMDGKNVLQYLMEDKIGLKANNITWLNEDDEYSKYGVQLGYHGSERVNGGSASPLTFGKGLGKIVIAHKHSPSLQENSYVIGMACEKEQGYNTGLSSWMSTSALVYPNGTVQLINFLEVDGEYKCGILK